MLLRGSEESEARTLTVVGAAVVLCFAVIGMLIVYNPFAGLAGRQISVTIDAPYVGQGVADGTAVVMHGVEVGEVKASLVWPGEVFGSLPPCSPGQ